MEIQSDVALTLDPVFGDSSAILARRADFYKLALGVLSQVQPQPQHQVRYFLRATGSMLDPVVRDPTLRLMIHDGLRALQHEECPGTDLQATLGQLFSANPYDWRSLPERELSPNIAIPGTRVTIWTHAVGPAAARLAKQFVDEALPNRLVGTVSSGELLPASDQQIELVNSAVGILFDSLPRLAQSILQHVTIVAWANVYTDDARMESGAARTIPGMIFLSPEDLATPRKAAEALLHEAVHAKLFDIYITSSILRGSYNAINSPRLTVPWNEATDLQSNDWPLDQALAALHVYVHLAAFAQASRGLYLREAQELYERSSYKAKFLLDGIMQEADTLLASEGQRFVHWLERTLLEPQWRCSTARAPGLADPITFSRDPFGGFAWSPALKQIIILGRTAFNVLTGTTPDASGEVTARLAEFGLDAKVTKPREEVEI